MEATVIDAPHLAFLIAAGILAGAQNVLAGGGSFLTFPALLLAGLNPLAANMTSTVAMIPGQITAAVAGRDLVDGVGGLRFRDLLAISLVGGALGALLLQNTPVAIFVRLVPWLVLFATLVFAWGSFRPAPLPAAGARNGTLPTPLLALTQGAIAVYGGYFGGGIGFLMLAALTLFGLRDIHAMNGLRILLAMLMNGAAVAAFALAGAVSWPETLAMAGAAVAGGYAGAMGAKRVDPARLKTGVVVIGAVMTVCFFVKGA